MKQILNNRGGWHTYYLMLFYLSTTFAVIFSFLFLQSRKWISIKGDIINRALLAGESAFSKLFLGVLTVFLILNTLYLIKKRD